MVYELYDSKIKGEKELFLFIASTGRHSFANLSILKRIMIEYFILQKRTFLTVNYK